MSNSTIDYYNHNAVKFTAGTVDVEFTQIQDRFISLLKPDSKILDFGCGSGRDTKYFLNRGFNVDASDGSEEMCRIAAQFTGIPVKQMLFSDLNSENEYDGIWACSSILHLPKEELKAVFNQITTALKSDGVLYTSFKYGTFEGERNGRYFTDFTEDTFDVFLSDIPHLQIVDEWVTEDARPDRKNEKWLNLILRKR